MADQITRVSTGKVRFSYAHVFEPTSVEEGGDKKYNISILVKKSDKETIKILTTAYNAAKQKGLNEKFGNKMPKNLDGPFKDGDEKSDEVYAGHWYFGASSKRRPAVVDKNFQAILDPEDFYSGCFGRVCVNFYAYNVGVNKGVTAGLESLMKLSDGEPLGGSGGNPENDFADNSKYNDEEEDDLLD